MNRVPRNILIIISLLLFFTLAWYFSSIVFYVVTAGILSLIGKPLVNYLDNVKIRSRRLPHSLNAALVLVLMILFSGGLILLFVPMIVQQGRMISAIDLNALSAGLQQPLSYLSGMLSEYGLLKSGETIESVLLEKTSGLVGVATFSNLFSDIIGIAGSFVTFTFSVLFMTFFFLRDDKLFLNSILLFVPNEYETRTIQVLHQVKHLMTRYFVGLCIQILIMATLLSIGLSILGIKNALLIGFFAGIMIIIPYLGPLIGSFTGITLTIIDCLSHGMYGSILEMSLKVGAVFLAANLVDNIIIQPLIYSNSVKAHPVEIFLVIIIAGSVAGITGMILAIPVYTILRIASKEFLGGFNIVRKLTRNI